METQDWKKYDELYALYEKAHSAYLESLMKLRGCFSEMARSYDKATLDHNRLYEEEQAHKSFIEAREKLHEFLGQKLKKD